MRENPTDDVLAKAMQWRYDRSYKGDAARLVVDYIMRYCRDSVGGDNEKAREVLRHLWLVVDEINEYVDELSKDIDVHKPEPKKLLVCGSRDWSNRDVIHQFLANYPKDTIVIEGECWGADRLARQEASDLGYAVRGFPADWSTHGKAAGPIRNKRMLEEGPDLVIAFHNDLESSKGTKNMVDQARKAGVPVLVITENQEDQGGSQEEGQEGQKQKG